MLDFDFDTLRPFIFILVGIVLVLIVVLKKSTKSNLKHTGLKTEGVVYALAARANNTSSINDSVNVKDKVTIRFVTQNKEWITGDIKQEFAAFFSGQYKEGQKVDVYYDPKNPSNFFVDTKQSEILSKIFFAVVGLTLILIGLYKLLDN